MLESLVKNSRNLAAFLGDLVRLGDTVANAAGGVKEWGVLMGMCDGLWHGTSPTTLVVADDGFRDRWLSAVVTDMLHKFRRIACWGIFLEGLGQTVVCSVRLS
jgi:hypothetical protein